MAQTRKKRIIVGVSGASGTLLARAVLLALRTFPEVDTHLVLTEGAERTLALESGSGSAALTAFADVLYGARDLGAPIASGSFRTDGMIVVPCSMKTAAGIANGYSDNLLLRAADVVVKEQRPLILVPREAPLSPIHLKNLLELSRLPGVRIILPVLNNYQHVVLVEELERQIALKLLTHLGLESPDYRRWTEA